MNFESIKNCLIDLQKVITQLSAEDFCIPIDNLSGATIGEHSRHIIELFQSVVNAYEDYELDYDNRKRDKQIETNKKYALQTIETILSEIEKPNKPLLLKHKISEETTYIETNYFREMLYNLEHCIHHQALIKVAILQIQYINLDANFGVAPSTIAYRNQCAQ